MKTNIIMVCYIKNSNAIDTNYFTIFLQTADVALIFSKYLL